jgi:predicted O-linked N-acetylglucosamine transferase (SPINDLY family)
MAPGSEQRLDVGFVPTSVQTLSQKQQQLDGRFALGAQLFQQNRREEALAFYGAALATATDAPTRAYLLGHCAQSLNGLGRIEESLEHTLLALELDPSQLSALCARAYAFLLLQHFQSCLECCDRGLVFHPDRIELLHNRTAALAGLMRNEEALATSERILAIHPGDARAWSNSAVMLDRLGRHEESLYRYKRAVALNPHEPWALGALLTAQLRMFDWHGLDALLSTIATQVSLGKPAVEPFRYLPACADPQRQLDAARVYVARRNLKPKQVSVFQRPGAQDRRLRIGYFSSDLRSHPVMELMAEVFELHDREQFETHAFSFYDDPEDAAQIRASAAFDHFHRVDGMVSEDIIALALSLQLDIAVDLNGHTMGARPVVLATRVAPIQMAYLGFPASMGADYIDYILADKVAIPPTHRHFYSEKVISLPVSFQPNDRQRMPAGQPLTRTDYGLPEQGFVYASFNAPMKLQPDVFACWMDILKAVDGSVLWVYSNSQAARGNLRREAAVHGVDAARIVFAPRVPLPEHFARHRCADLFLDTSPFNAGATASCALWCELPVLTVAGDTFASRYGASLLTAAGLPELITYDLETYQAMAVNLARSPDTLQAIKHRLSAARHQSALFDTPRFVRHLEAAYRAAWQRFCNGLPPDHIDVSAPAVTTA